MRNRESPSQIKSQELEARIIRLEEGLWFQEQNLKELDEIIHQLQKQQDLMARQLEGARKLLLNVREVLDAQSGGDPCLETPPHYQQEK